MSLAVFFLRRRPILPSESGETKVSLIPKPAPKSLIDLDDTAVEKKYTEGKGRRNPRALLPSIHFPQRRAYKKGGEFRKQLAEVSGRGRRKKGGGWGSRMNNSSDFFLPIPAKRKEGKEGGRGRKSHCRSFHPQEEGRAAKKPFFTRHLDRKKS